MKKRNSECKEKQIIKLRDDLYVNINQIDCIIKTDTHPTDNSKLSETKYCVYFIKNSHYTWALITKKEFDNNVKPFI